MGVKWTSVGGVGELGSRSAPAPVVDLPPSRSGATPRSEANRSLVAGTGVANSADAPAIAREVSALLRDETRRHAIRKNAYRLGREMVWSNVARQYLRSFERARLDDCDGRLWRPAAL